MRRATTVLLTVQSSTMYPAPVCRHKDRILEGSARNRHWTRLGATGWSLPMPKPFPDCPPFLEQLFDNQDLDAAVEKATRANPLGAYPLLDTFITDQCIYMVPRLHQAGTPSVLAHELFHRMREMAHVSALAMHCAIWRSLLPSEDVAAELGPKTPPDNGPPDGPPPS